VISSQGWRRQSTWGITEPTRKMISSQLAFSRALRTYTRAPRGEPRRFDPAKLWNDPYRYLGLELAQPVAEAEWLRANPLWLSAGKVQSVGYARQFGKRSGLHLVHHVAAVDFHGDLANAQVRRNLLVESSRHDVRHALALARAQGREPLPQRSDHLFVVEPGAIARQALLDCF